MAWPLPMDTLSPSALAQFNRCPEQFRRQRIKGEWDRSSVAGIIGSAVHGSAEINFKQKTTTGTDLPMGDVELAYAETFDKEVEDAGGPREIDWTMRVGRDRLTIGAGAAKDRGVPLAQTYRRVVAPSVQPLGAEEWFRIKVPGVPVDIRGRIDVIEATKVKTDLKFGASLKTKPEVPWRLQGLTYLLVDQTSEKDGTPRLTELDDFDFSWQTGTWGTARMEPRIVTPAQSPELMLRKTDNTIRVAQSLIRSTVDAMTAYWEKFGPDDPWPGALQHSWACNYCPFGPQADNTCFWWTGVREELVLI